MKKPAKEKSRSRVLSPIELKAVWQACPDDNFGRIVQLLILTGQRRGEAAAIRSDWLDGHLLTFPAHITKNGAEHQLPLGPFAHALLAKTLPASDGPRGGTVSARLLFPSAKTGRVITGWAKLKDALDQRSNVTNWTLHDLRRTFATVHAEIGTPPHITEILLNHKTSDHLTPISKIYNRFRYQNECRQAMCRYEQHIRNLVAVEAP